MQTIFFNNKPKIIGTSSIAGPKESNGCIADYIETKLSDDTYGEKTYEKAESRMLFTVIKNSIINSGLMQKDIDCLIAGDLLNQITASTFSARRYVPLYSPS